LSSNTDFHAQLANSFEDNHDMSFEERERRKKKGELGIVPDTLLNLDLATHSDSILAGSVSQICEGVIGRSIAEGSMAHLINSKINYEGARAQLVEDFHAAVREMKEEVLREVGELIRVQVEERLRPHSSTDELRARVENFSLLEAEVRNHDNDQAEEQADLARRGLI